MLVGPTKGSIITKARTDLIVTPRARTPAVVAWSQFAWLGLVALAWSGLLVRLSTDPDYTAGELLDHFQSWREGAALYPVLGATPPLRVLNYPPLVLLLIRGVTAAGIPPLLAGRGVDALGLVAMAAGVAWWAWARGARGAMLAGTVGLLGASFPVLYGAGQFHVELWGAAGTIWGFALLDRAASWKGAALGGVALALGCFAKQTQAIPALVALGWAWVYRPPRAAAATAGFAGTGALGAAAITAAWGMEPWSHLITYTVGTYSAANLATQLASHVAPWAMLFAIAASQWWTDRALVRADPVWWYWVGALLWSLSAARVGSGYPYFLDLHLATALLVGPRVFGAAQPRRPLLTWLLAAQIVGADLGVAAALGVNVARLERTEAELPALCARLAPQPTVVTEEAGVARACGRSALIHPFITTSLAAQGLWDPTPFEAGLRAGAYSAALLPFDPRVGPEGVHAERWTAGELAAFRSAPIVEAAPTGRWIARW